jgi:hypothetical protein
VDNQKSIVIANQKEMVQDCEEAEIGEWQEETDTDTDTDHWQLTSK